jgi:hypothetical protein
MWPKIINGSLQHVSEKMVLSNCCQKTCMTPTFFDVNGIQIQGNMSIIIFIRKILNSNPFKSIQNHLNPLNK